MHKKLALSTSNLELEDEMIGLHQSINSLLPDSQKRVIQFLGTRDNEGTSSIVREFAIVSVMKFGKSTLLLDASGQYNSALNITSVNCLEETIQNNEPIDKAIYQVADSSLFLCQFFKEAYSTPKIFDSFVIDDLLKKLTLRFDLILIDSPPSTTFSISLAVSNKISGVVLIMEAEKTRWPVVDSIKDTIMKKGGKVLGIVLNKRRYYIPDFIYKRL